MKNGKVILALGLIVWSSSAWAYPPAVGIVGKAKNCLVCHINNGPWQDDQQMVVDLLDAKTKQSFKQADGSFLIKAERHVPKTVLAVLGRAKGDPALAPTRNGWLFIDPQRISEESPSNKFPKGWEVNQSLGCRMVGDPLPGYEGSALTVASMTLLATAQAKEVQMEWQAMLARGESVKGKAREGLQSTTVVKKVKLVVKEPAPDQPKSDDK
jgi:hypothetical protein